MMSDGNSVERLAKSKREKGGALGRECFKYDTGLVISSLVTVEPSTCSAKVGCNTRQPEHPGTLHEGYSLDHRGLRWETRASG